MMLDYLYLQPNWCFSLQWEETLCMHVVVPLPIHYLAWRYIASSEHMDKRCTLPM